jgi:hypothetical protein
MFRRPCYRIHKDRARFPHRALLSARKRPKNFAPGVLHSQTEWGIIARVKSRTIPRAIHRAGGR